MKEFKRYGIVNAKLQSEVVMLRGLGCTWKRCAFCDYCDDYNMSIMENYRLNREVLKNVTGVHNRLFVICSGSFAELDNFTIQAILDTCIDKNIENIIFEGHWQHRGLIEYYRHIFRDFSLEFNVGAESFDVAYRERTLTKGMGNVSPYEIRQYFERTNLMFGIKGQSYEQFIADAFLAVELFNFVTINVFVPNKTHIERDNDMIAKFYNSNEFKELKALDKCMILDDLSPHIVDSFDMVGSEVTC